MNDKKIDYLTRQLKQALLNKSYADINSYYKELLKLVSAEEISELAEKVNAFNASYEQEVANKNKSAEEKVKHRIRKAKKRNMTHRKMRLHGLRDGLIAMVLGCILLIAHMEADYKSPLNDYAYMVLAISISGAGFLGVILGAIAACLEPNSNEKLGKYRKEVFDFLCGQETNLQFLDNVEANDDNYVGQTKDYDPHGFGICLCQDNTIYVGEWQDGGRHGIGKLYSDDLAMVLEGEFQDDEIHGIVDIQWEDGSEWHGEYRDNIPWNGSGKAFINGFPQQGTWKKGDLVSR